jgi:serine/threonine protein kinase
MNAAPPRTRLLCRRYALGQVIGRGGMAEVREAWDTRCHRPVAVKRVRPELAANEELHRRFLNELRLSEAIHDPNVVEVLDEGEHAGVPFIVMERLPGDTLRDRLHRGPLPPVEVRQLARQLLSALDAVHRAGVVHLDVKPRNVFCTRSRRWKLGDFGIAAELASSPGQSRRAPLLGTPDYLAPEVLFGDVPSPAADLYAVGVVLFESLFGTRPSAASGAVDLSSPAAGVPDDLRRLIERCLEPAPADRFESASAARDAIASPPAEQTQRLEPDEDTRTMPAAFVPAGVGRDRPIRAPWLRGDPWRWATAALVTASLVATSFAFASGTGASRKVIERPAVSTGVRRPAGATTGTSPTLRQLGRPHRAALQPHVPPAPRSGQPRHRDHKHRGGHGGD